MKKSLALFFLFSIFVANISMGQPTPPQNTDRSGNNNNIGYGNREPIYLPEMQNGVVKIRVLVDTNGSVKEAQIVQHGTTITSQSVRQECLDVAKQAKYQPSSKEEYNFIVLRYPNGSDKNVNAQRGNNGYGPRGNGENGNGYGPRDGNRNGGNYGNGYGPRGNGENGNGYGPRDGNRNGGNYGNGYGPQGNGENGNGYGPRDGNRNGGNYGNGYGPRGNGENGNGYGPREGNRNGENYGNGYGPRGNGENANGYGPREGNRNGENYGNGYGPRGNGENGNGYGPREGNRNGENYGNGYGPREGNRNGSDYINRRPIFIPEMTIPENETVKIRVLIGVDGVVKEAEIIPQGTTINDPEMRQQCLDAAKRAKYQPSPREEYSFIVFPKGNDDNMYERQGNGYRPEEGNRNGGSYRNGAGPQDNGGN